MHLIRRLGQTSASIRMRNEQFIRNSIRTVCSKVNNENVHISNTHLELKSNAAKSLTYSHMWLRDHCRCEKCYNHTTNQRILNILNISPNIQPKECLVEDGTLSITWPDGHKSNYSLSWLEQNNYSNYHKAQQRKWIPWDKASVKTCGIAAIDLNEFIDSKSGLKSLLQSLVTFGVGFVKNVPPTVEATEKVVKQITHVQRTFFGDMWEFSDDMVHNDTAYTKEALGAHTDSTYFTEACGIQIFHCLHHDGTGGETLLVDGFNAALKLKENNPESYKRLSTYNTEAEFIEPGLHYLCIDPILKLHPVTAELQQIRFNLFDRSPMKTLPSDQVDQFYKDLRLLAKIIEDPAGEWWVKLSPGLVVFINNWRVLHGRAAYTGHRRMAGCYLGHADWSSIARVHGLL